MIIEYDRYQGSTQPPARPTPGQLAYEEDCRRRPRYTHGARALRPFWHELPAHCRRSWEENPTPRDYRT